MKYEFNIGDYVETKDGTIGYIDSINYDYKYDWYDINILLNVKGYVGKIHGNTDYITKEFNRIGKYDFTKPQKIEKLEYAHIDKKYGTKIETKANGENLVSKGVQNVYVKTTDVEIIDKINEIIDKLNEMER